MPQRQSRRRIIGWAILAFAPAGGCVPTGGNIFLDLSNRPPRAQPPLCPGDTPSVGVYLTAPCRVPATENLSRNRVALVATCSQPAFSNWVAALNALDGRSQFACQASGWESEL